jgi:hypothetical protein
VHAHESPAALELLAVEAELELALAIALDGIALALLWGPGAAVPEEDGAAAVLPLGDDPLEATVIQRMVLDVDGQALLAGIEARPLGHGPAPQHAFHLQPEVVVQARGVMALHHETMLRLFLDFWRRFGCFLETPFTFVFVEGHKNIVEPSRVDWS